MPRGDYLRKGTGKELKKICTACGWKGVVGFYDRKCPECGNLNLRK
jgi:predicted RNA-binding Zn-ribbon protein involved in translation (DUF1610 family)